MLKNPYSNLLLVIERQDFEHLKDIVQKKNLSSEYWEALLVLMIDRGWSIGFEYLMVQKPFRLFTKSLLGCGINALHLSIYKGFNEGVLAINANETYPVLDAMGFTVEEWAIFCKLDGLILYEWIKKTSNLIKINSKTGVAPFEWSDDPRLWAWVGSLLWSKYNCNWLQWGGPVVSDGKITGEPKDILYQKCRLKNDTLSDWGYLILGMPLLNWLYEQFRWEKKFKKSFDRKEVPEIDVCKVLDLKDIQLETRPVGYWNEVLCKGTLGAEIEDFNSYCFKDFFEPSMILKLGDLQRFKMLKNVISIWMSSSVWRLKSKSYELLS